MHEHVNPPSLLEPVGFAHAVVATPGRTVFLGGQTGHHGDGSISPDLAPQFRQALKNLVTVLNTAGAQITDLVSMQVYVTDVVDYRTLQRELGQIWRSELGRHYPAMALFEVTALHDARAQVELLATAVIATSETAYRDTTPGNP